MHSCVYIIICHLVRIVESSGIQNGNGCYSTNKRKVNYMLFSYVFEVIDDCGIAVELSSSILKWILVEYVPQIKSTVCLLFLFVCMDILKELCFRLQSLLFLSIFLVLLSVIVALILSERDRQERELYHFYSPCF